MTATDKAKAYLKQLAPHVRDREAASVIRDLIAENDGQRDMIIRAINGAIRRRHIEVAEGRSGPKPAWSITKSLFGHGSTVSAEICRKYGFDPDREIGADK